MPIMKRKKIFKKSVLHAFKKKFCRFCKDRQTGIDYKDVKRLERFVSDRAKILSTRATGNCAKHQRIVAHAVKKARFLALLPYKS